MKNKEEEVKRKKATKVYSTDDVKTVVTDVPILNFNNFDQEEE